jgi:hypothetical protein
MMSIGRVTKLSRAATGDPDNADWRDDQLIERLYPHIVSRALTSA